MLRKHSNGTNELDDFMKQFMNNDAELGNDSGSDTNNDDDNSSISTEEHLNSCRSGGCFEEEGTDGTGTTTEDEADEKVASASYADLCKTPS